MKIRIRGNSVRIRITQTELKHFGANGQLQEETLFGLADQQRLIYILKRSEQHQALHASISGQCITVSMPTEMAEDWVNTNRITCEDYMPIGNGENLRILIEKDFKCLDHTIEDQSDMFENPNKAHHC